MNISEIAKLAGVSAATVSRYLNNGYLSDEKRARIERVIKETGYVPSQQAKTLRTGKTKLIGVIIPKIDSDSISRVVAGVSEILNAKGYQLILANTENDPDKELEYIEIFRHTKVDGIIHLGTVKTDKHRAVFRELTIPTVILGQEAEFTACIYHDDYQAACELAQYVIKKGCKSPAYVGVTQEDEAVGKQRRAGVTDTMRAHGKDIFCCEGSFRMDNGYENAKLILETHPETDAIICATDTIAFGVVKYLNEVGIAIPDRIGVAGMGDSKFASVLSPTLTTVHYFYRECGQEGARLLLEKIEDANLPARKIKMACRVVENASL